MKLYSKLNFKIITLVLLIIISQKNAINAQQSIYLGIHANPLIGWFGSHSSAITSHSPKTGFNFGLNLTKYFYENYAFSTGLSLITSGGNFSCNDTITLQLENPSKVYPKNRIVYNIHYLSIPVGIKLRTNQIGFISIFTDIGLDPKVTLGGKVAIPSQHIPKDKAASELKAMSMGYHIIGGIEYSLGGNTEVVLGINFENNFTDIIKHPSDKISHKMFGLHLGLNF